MLKIRDLSTPRVKEFKYWLFIFLLIAFHALNNYIWLKQDPESPGKDFFHHVKIALTYRQGLSEIFSSDISIANKLRLTFNFFTPTHPYNPQWPSLVHFTVGLTSFLFRDVIFGIRFINITYFSILIISIYLLGKKIHSSEAGIISACLVSLYPPVFWISRKFGLDFPLMCFVPLIIYFLIRSEGFQNRFFSIIFGVTFGLGMLIKGQCLFFIIGPLVYAAIKGIKNKNRINFITNLGISLIIAFLIALIWWHWILILIKSGLVGNLLLYRQTGPGFDELSGSGGWVFYLKGIFLSISLPLFFVFLIGVFYYLKKLKEPVYLTIFLWLFVPYLIFSLISTKFIECIFAVFGAVALISAVGWLTGPFKKTKKALLCFFIVFGFYQYYALSYFERPRFILANIRKDFCYLSNRNNHRKISGEINAIIQKIFPTERGIAIIETEYFRGDLCVRLSYLLKMLDRRNFISCSMLGSLPSLVRREFLEKADNYDFLICFACKDYPPDFSGLVRYAEVGNLKLAAEVEDKFRKYKVIKEDILRPEDIRIFLLKKK